MNLILGEGRFDCAGCGNCCRADWTIRVEPTKWEKLTEFGPKLAIANPILPKEAGRCVFLEADARCRVHAQLGAASKPLDCQMFPFVLTPTPDGLEVGLSYFCPSVRGQQGRPLEGHAVELERLGREARLPLTLTGPFRLHGTSSTGWAGYKFWEQELLSRLPQDPERVLEGALVGLLAHHASWGRIESEALFEPTGISNVDAQPLVRELMQLIKLRSKVQEHYPDPGPYLRSLVERKFLLKQPTVAQGLAILSAIPKVLRQVDYDLGVEHLELVLSHAPKGSTQELADSAQTLIMGLCPNTSRNPSPPQDPPLTPEPVPAPE